MELEILTCFSRVLYPTTTIFFVQDSVILVPESEWNLDMVTPKLYCTTKDGKCIQMDYMNNGVLVEPRPEAGEPRPSFLINPKVNVKYIKPRVNVMDFDSESKTFFRKLYFFYIFVFSFSISIFREE